MRITRQQMQDQGFLFNDEGEGYADSLKDKVYAPNGFDAFVSTGHYFDNGDYVHFWYSFGGGSDREFDHFPE